MPTPDLDKIIAFSTPDLLRHWLEVNHMSERELWVKIFKKGSDIKSITWDDLVIECLCWGWIDGVKKSLDDVSYIQRITPRTQKSIWSKRNTEHVERLITEGRMQQSGLAHVNAAKADGRWEKAYVVSQMEVPEDFLAELLKHETANQFYQTLTKSSRNIIAYGLTSAKKPETRQRRFTKFLNCLIDEQKPS